MSWPSVPIPCTSKIGIYTYSTITAGPKRPYAFNIHTICPFKKERFRALIKQCLLNDYPLALVKWSSTGIARFVDGEALFEKSRQFSGKIKDFMESNEYSSINLFKLYRKGHGLLHIAKYKIQKNPLTSIRTLKTIALQTPYKLQTLPYCFVVEQSLSQETLNDYARALISFEQSIIFNALILHSEELRDEESMNATANLFLYCENFQKTELTTKKKLSMPTQAIMPSKVSLSSESLLPTKKNNWQNPVLALMERQRKQDIETAIPIKKPTPFPAAIPSTATITLHLDRTENPGEKEGLLFMKNQKILSSSSSTTEEESVTVTTAGSPLKKNAKPNLKPKSQSEKNNWLSSIIGSTGHHRKKDIGAQTSAEITPTLSASKPSTTTITIRIDLTENPELEKKDSVIPKDEEADLLKKIHFSDQIDIAPIVKYLNSESINKDKPSRVAVLAKNLKRPIFTDSLLTVNDDFAKYLLKSCIRMPPETIAHHLHLIYFLYKDLKTEKLYHNYNESRFFEGAGSKDNETDIIFRILQVFILNCEVLCKNGQVQDGLIRLKSAYRIYPKIIVSLLRKSSISMCLKLISD